MNKNDEFETELAITLLAFHGDEVPSTYEGRRFFSIVLGLHLTDKKVNRICQVAKMLISIP